jgi:ATP-dependent exoDNAse (exonuclease V) beta subunit
MTTDTDDTAARRRIAEDLDTNIMVVAGAGTGKTTALVARIVALVRGGAVSLREIAAITFTEAAAAELRDQVRRAIESADDGEDDRMVTARHQLDEAAICTLHAFAQRILLEQCVEAGLPPRFDVLDDTAEVADFEARWTRFADTLLADPDAERALVLGFSVGLRHTDLAAVAWNLHGHWDRLEDGGLAYLQAAARCDEHWPPTDPGPVLESLDRALNSVPWCTDDEDKMLLHLRGTLTDARAQLIAAGPDPLAVLQLLVILPPWRCAQGRQENWGGHIADVRAACAEAEQTRLDHLDAIRRAVLGDLVARLATFTLVAAEERRVEGRLTFHDLLVHARRLLRAGGDPLELLRQRYRRLLVDEFQDTDPIQVELAARLAGAVDAPAEVGGARPGALFVVGDPQQSIYRFRRADIDLFDRVSTDMASSVALRTNFRSLPGIVDFVNVVFEEIFGPGTIPDQARHVALLAARPGPMAEPSGVEPLATAPAATVQLTFEGIGGAGDPHPSPSPRARPTRRPHPGVGPSPVITVGGALAASAPEIRRRAAGDAATAIDHLVRHRWLVEDIGTGTRRPVRFADITVLIPARSSLLALEDALDEAAVPYRLEGAALLWGAEEVREVLAVLRATDDPADAVAVLGALRSPGLACGDDDLVTWHAAGGSWDPRTAPPPGLEGHPVAQAMDGLHRLHRERWWSEPSAMVAATYRELRSFELVLSHPRPRDYWHRLRWLQDQARLFDETPGGTMRAFLAWAQRRAAGDGRVGSVGPPDPDDDAVRVMTIHGAKGLEFPVVVLAGLERDQADAPRPPAVVWTDDHTPEIRVGPFRTAGFEQAGLRDQHLDDLERHRLLYVGMTRARDYLVLCLHHKQRNSATDSSLAALVTRICAANPALRRGLPDIAAHASAASPSHRGVDGGHDASTEPGSDNGDQSSDGGEPVPAGWAADRARLLASLRRRPVTTATTVARHAAAGVSASGADPVTAVDPDWPDSPVEWDHAGKARHVGRAVHAALADIDLATRCDAAGRPAPEVARAHALARGVADQASEVATMVDRALASPTVVRASSRRYWREVPVTTAVGHGGVLEGFVDLLFEDEDGLVIVDYKTDRITGAPQPPDVATAYLLQVAAYALALETSTGRRVHRCVLVFAGGDAPHEHTLEGQELASAEDEGRRVADLLVNR